MSTSIRNSVLKRSLNTQNNQNTRSINSNIHIKIQSQGKQSKYIREIFGLEDNTEKKETKKMTIKDLNKNIFFFKQDFEEKERKLETVLSQVEKEEKIHKAVIKLAKQPKKISIIAYKGQYSPRRNIETIASKSPFKPQNSVNKIVIKSPDIQNKGKSGSKNSSGSNMFEYIPCVNCNNMINLKDIESHSDKCNKVKEEVQKVEDSKFSYHVVDFKLKKLKEHISKLKTQEKEIEEIATISSIIEEAIDVVKISPESLVNLKKIILRIDVSSSINLLPY